MQGAELGASVTLVERKRVGGTSINEGPAPIRTLARAARLARDAKSWETFGLRGAAPTVDVKAAVANATRVADYSHDVKRMSDYIAACGVELVQNAGPARFVDDHTIEVEDGRRFSGDAIVVAVGGHAGRLPIPGAELALTTCPRRPNATPVMQAARVSSAELAGWYASTGKTSKATVRHRLSAGLDPGGFRFQGHRAGVRGPDQTSFGSRCLGRPDRGLRGQGDAGDHRHKGHLDRTQR